ncbi:MAG: hypothetical protein ACE366_01070 [Bradymonadia bacterium]
MRRSRALLALSLATLLGVAGCDETASFDNGQQTPDANVGGMGGEGGAPGGEGGMGGEGGDVGGMGGDGGAGGVGGVGGVGGMGGVGGDVGGMGGMGGLGGEGGMGGVEQPDPTLCTEADPPVVCSDDLQLRQFCCNYDIIFCRAPTPQDGCEEPQCEGDADCPGAYCYQPGNPAENRCVECLDDNNCPENFSCGPNKICVQTEFVENVESCMECHNGSDSNDYAGNGINNPHPFPGASNVTCSQCHGGNPRGQGKINSHVPPPPAIGNREQQINNPESYFNRLTLVGIDKLEPATYGSNPDTGQPWSNLDYIQFVNPGDLRVVEAGRGCGDAGCHDNGHGEWVPRSIIATTTGIFSGTRFTMGVENRIAANRGRDKDGDSLADSAPRRVENPNYQAAVRRVGEVSYVNEQPELAQYNGAMRDNAVYDANQLANHIINENQDRARPNRVRTGSPLETLVDEQVSITCGNCHLGNAGANNRFADFRSSGCTSCHMEYSYDGRSRSQDPHVDKREPLNPDAIDANLAERPHVEAHMIRNVAKVLPNGAFARGISDRACVGCHQGSNRTVLQYWGIRMDQNADVVNNFQYPANPQNFATTENDTRLYDPAVNNATFNGRNFNQHLLTEDYDGDNRDDTPADIHYERGMGCIDCHGSRDLHGGTEGDPSSGKIPSRQNQTVAITCESCHGWTDRYAETADCFTYDGRQAQCATDNEGNPMRHVTRDDQDNYWLISRVDQTRHYVPQTRDVVVQNQNKRHPINQQLIYSPNASYAMGRADGSALTGLGPRQADPLIGQNFSHLDTMDCSSCHASWTNNCIGCHLKTEYEADPGQYFFSNITGERILLKEANADFVYQNPLAMYLGVNSRGKITQISPAEKWFFRYEDFNNNESDVFAFSDRLGEGNNPFKNGGNAFPALNHNQMAAHSTRGKVSDTQEGPRYCVSCHLNVDQLNNFGDEYAEFLDVYANNDFANLDFDLLQEHIGQNTGNQLNSPIWVHMVAGRGSGLFLFDATGCPVNPLDANDNRQYCPDGAPADNFDANNVVYDLDRIVEFTGIPNSSSIHPRTVGFNVGTRRDGATNPEMAGPLPGRTIQLLTDPNIGVVLDSWFDADGAPQGNADNFLQ